MRKEWADVHKVPFFASPRYDAALDAVCQRLGVHDTHIAHNGPNSKIVEGSARPLYIYADRSDRAAGETGGASA